MPLIPLTDFRKGAAFLSGIGICLAASFRCGRFPANFFCCLAGLSEVVFNVSPWLARI